MTKPMKTALFAALMTTTAFSAANAEIKIGFITSMSGAVSSIGIPYSRGIKAGESYISEVGGQKFTVVALDDASDISNASKLARKLIEEDKVDVLIGTAGAPGSAAIMAVAFLGEPFGWYHAVGLTLVLGGIAWAEKYKPD